MTLFAGEPPHGVSEHTARTAPVLATALSTALATAWSPRSCVGREAVVVLCPEHVKTIHRDGWSKEHLRQFLFERTAVPVRAYRASDGGEGTQQVAAYAEVVVDGEPCYRKFPVAGVDPHRGRGRHGGQILGGDRRLVGRPARQSDGDVSR